MKLPPKLSIKDSVVSSNPCGDWVGNANKPRKMNVGKLNSASRGSREKWGGPL